MTWQGIETAPKDGSKFLAYTISRGPGDHSPFYRMEVAYWRDGGRGFFYAPNGIPTHWMPLPDPPEVQP